MPGIQGQPHFIDLIPWQDTAWMEDAVCAGRDDLDWFDLDCGLQQAATLCYSCPVQTDCLEYAVELRVKDGLWGGLWGDQLQTFIRRRVRSRS